MSDIQAFEVTTVIRNDDYVVRDHRVHGARIMPGVTFLDMVYRGLARFWEPWRVELKNILFRHPIVTSEEFDRRVKFSFVPNHSASSKVVLNVTATSLKEKAGVAITSVWEEHFWGEVVLHDTPLQGSLDLERLKAGAVQVTDLDEAYAIARGLDIQHREFMKGAGRIWRGADSVLAEVGLGDVARPYEQRFLLHPTYLDTSTLIPVLFHAGKAATRQPYIPLFIESFRMAGPLVGPVYVHAVDPGDKAFSDDLVHGDHDLYDARGRLLARFVKLTGKRIRNEDLITRLSGSDTREPVPARAQRPVAAPAVATSSGGASGAPSSQEERLARVEAELAELVGATVQVPGDELPRDRGFYELGLDSTHLLGLVRKLEERVGASLYPTLLFEHNDLSKLAKYLLAEHPAAFQERAGTKPSVAVSAPVASAPRGPAETVYCRPEWFPAPAEASSPLTGWTLLLASEPEARDALASALGEASSRLVWLRPAEAFAHEGAERFAVRPGSHEDGARVLAALAEAGRAVSRVVLMAPRGGVATETGGLFLLQGVVRALLERGGTEPVSLLAVHEDVAEHAAFVALGGYLRSLRVEVPRMTGRTVALVPGTAWADVGARVAVELRTPGSDAVRHGAGTRFVQALQELKPGAGAGLPVRARGVYLITGGAGGLGLIVARQLARRGAGVVVLVGRSELDATRRERLQALDGCGATVMYQRADTSSEAAVQALCARVRERFGALHGVVHGAGETRDALVRQKSVEDMRSVLAPKVHGTRLLDAATRDDDLDFFLLLSSLSALTGNVGQSDYAHANAFMDAFAHERERQRGLGLRRGRTVSINWPLWREGGMQVEAGAEQAMWRHFGAIPLETAAGLEAMDAAFRLDGAQLAVLSGDAARLRESFHVRSLAAPASVAAPATASGAALEQDEPIAIVGVSGQYPQAEDLTEFWANLKAGRDCVTEVPRERWDVDALFDADPARSVEGRSYSRWGGFLRHADRFDPLFFSLSPREAGYMDPQERLFLQTAWSAVEDAGYKASELNRSRVGVFVGVMWGQYQLLGVDGQDPVLPLSSSFSSVANRVSFSLNLKGPSLAVDTMCSSSLTALHLACESLRRGECELALAGGVNVQPHSSKYVLLSQARMLSADGRCRAFGEGGTGYVPAEGVGCVVLKPLRRAVADGDVIHGVILASALNHGGRTGGFSVPDPIAQAEAVREALTRAHVAPEEVSYIEAHGTGTSLGDPIEIAGLVKAFGGGNRRGEPCAIGSVKSNIGHAESAAGVAALTKVLLQLRHGELVASLHADTLNPSIDFQGAGFQVTRKNAPWPRRTELRDGVTVELPRVAGLSSFGAGGSNAHVVVREYLPVKQPARAQDVAPQLVVLSARDEERLREYAQRLLAALSAPGAAWRLDDVAHTLQVGRDEQAERLAVVARTSSELVAALDAFCRGTLAEGVHRGTRRRAGGAGALAETASLDAVARHWVAGGAVDWTRLGRSTAARRISLPTYPFLKERFWPPEPRARESVQGAVEVRRAPSLFERQTSSGGMHRFERRFTSHEPLLADHRFQGQALLPGAAMLELAVGAASLMTGGAVARVQTLSWLRPVVVGTEPAVVAVEVRHAPEGVTFELRAGTEDDMGQTVARGSLSSGAVSPVSKVDVAALQRRCTRRLEREEVYARFARVGFEYGPSLRLIDSIQVGEGVALTRVRRDGTGGASWMDTALMDAALQTVVALGPDEGEASRFLPASLSGVELHRPMTAELYVWTRALETGSDDAREFALDLLDGEGTLLARVASLRIQRVAAAARPAPTPSELLFQVPRWVSAPHGASGAVSVGTVLVHGGSEARGLEAALLQAGAKRVVSVRPDAGFSERDDGSFTVARSAADYQRLLQALRSRGDFPSGVLVVADATPVGVGAEGVRAAMARGPGECFLLAQALLSERLEQPVRMLYVHRPEVAGPRALDVAVGGMARSLVKENPSLRMGVVAVSELEGAALAERLCAELVKGTESELRLHGPSTREVRAWTAWTPSTTNGAVRLRERGTYLLTGGLGGLGRVVAGHLAEKCHARLVLAGRSPADARIEQELSRLRAKGAEVLYVSADLGRDEDVARLVREAHTRFGAIHGVFQVAGVLRDGLAVRKTAADWDAVLGSKVYGTVALDEALAAEPLDFFVAFSSLAGVFGNAGQADYAFANAFLAEHLRLRERRRAAGQRTGASVCVDWPWWEEGSMALDARALAGMEERMGLRPLSTADGLRALEACLAAEQSQVAVAWGVPDTLRAAFGSLGAAQDVRPVETAASEVDEAVVARVAQELKRVLARQNRLRPEQIDLDESFSAYGVDSVAVMNMTAELERAFGELPKTLFFEHPTLRELSRFLTVSRTPAARRFAGLGAEPTRTAPPPPPVRAVVPASPKSPAPRQTTTDDRIAIVGVSGRYPQAPDLEAFWSNLVSGRDCITEVPPERWDVEAFFDANKDRVGTTYTRWGGFLEGIDRFDPLFFRIAPRDAEFMDPQERLFLETVWEAMEDGGYAKRTLEKRPVGVFAGVMWGQYQLLQARVGDGVVSPGSIFASVANRVSYAMDFRGPSLAVDTMCSSSLTALHLACESLRRGECEVAFAGGVNLSLHPSKYTLLSFQKFAASDGRCRAFGEGGDGYVPGEGVGVVMLKPLAKAVEDGDRIHAVIRASALNHGGKTNGFSVPNPNAQGELIARTLAAAGVRPDEVSYVEAHGTGTALGDPIELAGLSRAFGVAKASQSTCAIGSVKSNIGHLEAAAGIAALTKVVLQMRHRKLVPSLHAETLNPHLRFEGTPFVVQRELADWTVAGDRPRVAAISAFGAGGSNAHVVVEEWPRDERGVEATGPQAFLLSARNEERLTAYAARMAAFLRGTAPVPGAAPSASAPKRHAALVGELKDLLARELGLAAESLDATEPMRDYGMDEVLFARLLERVTERWAVEVSPTLLAESPSLETLATVLARELPAPVEVLPEARPAVARGPALSLRELAYTSQVGRDAFEERLAIIASSVEELAQRLEAIALGEGEGEGVFRGNSTQGGKDLSLLWNGEEGSAFVRSARSNGRVEKLARLWTLGADVDWAVLHELDRPQRAHLPAYPFARERYWIDEVPSSGPGTSSPARLALAPGEALTLEQTLSPGAWLVDDHRVGGTRIVPAAALVELARASARRLGLLGASDLRDVAFLKPLVVEAATRTFVRLTPDGTSVGFVIHSERGEVLTRGQLVPSVGGAPERVAVERLRQRLPRTLEAAAFYAGMARDGLAYGPTFQVVSEVFTDGREALVRLRAPDALRAATPRSLQEAVLLDGGLQAIGGLLASAPASATRGLPFAFTEVRIARALPAEAFAHVVMNATGGYDVTLTEDSGEVCWSLRGVLLKGPQAQAPAALDVANASPAARGTDAALAPKAATTARQALTTSTPEDSAFLAPAWVATPLANTGAAVRAPGSRSVLVVAPEACSGMDVALAGQHGEDGVYRLVLSTRTRQVGARAWEVIGSDVASLTQGLTGLGVSRLDDVYFLGGWAEAEMAPTDLDALERGQEQGVLGLFQLVKALRGRDLLSPSLRLKVVTNDTWAHGGRPSLNAQAASLFGLASAVAKEYGARTAVVDASLQDVRQPEGGLPGRWVTAFFAFLLSLLLRRPAASPGATQVARRIVDEPVSDDPRWILLRGKERLRQELRPEPLAVASTAPFREKGVYVIVGGTSGIGFELARHLARGFHAKLVLVGRREEDARVREGLDTLQRDGGEAMYVRADVTRPEAVSAVFREAIARWRGVNGVVHSAMELNDRVLEKMDEDTFRRTLAAKVRGSAVLWKVAREQSADFVVFFSSASSFSAIPGQSNYAAGNAFQDAFVRGLRASGYGSLQVINWGFWGSVGAAASEENRERFASMGIRSIQPEEGMEVLRRLIASGVPQAVYVKTGPGPVLPVAEEPAVVASPSPAPEVLPVAALPVAAPVVKTSPAVAPPTGDALAETVRDEVVQVLSRVLRVPQKRVRGQETFDAYGMDSLATVEITRALEASFGKLPATLMFTQNSVQRLTEYLLQHHRPGAEQLHAKRHGGAASGSDTTPVLAAAPTEAVSFPVALPPSDLTLTPPSAAIARAPRSAPPVVNAKEIAIVGMSGRYPEGQEPGGFAALLREGRSSVTEIPAERWDWRDYYVENPTRPGDVYSKWGSFLPDAYCFDPAFFRLTPLEAEFLDPQERLFTEAAWSAVEDAGYTPSSLGEADRKVGVFVGVMNNHYEHLAGESWGRGQVTNAGSRYWSIANRVSFLCDFQGPSMAVDTACSSSLVALHLACESLRRGECRAALVGGVNLILHPKHFVAYSAMNMLSVDGRCKSFGDGANGIVLGEGVGALVLKPLDAALRDGDNVYAVIRGTATNAGGRTSGYTVPNPRAQAEVVGQALDDAGIDPRTLGYVEAHGTGTDLGDPIEVAGLTQAFSRFTNDRAFCALGSVKSNVGHLESAAGVAGLTKILLQLKEKKLFPSLHADTLSRKIDFEQTPFYLQRELRDWPRPEGHPRRAALSSFGAGGANAHVVLEELVERPVATGNARPGPQVVVLSAKSPERLRARAEQLLAHLTQLPEHEQPSLADLAFTLQVGREAMDHRWALVSDSLEDLTRRLGAWLDGAAVDGLHTGQRDEDADGPADEVVEQALSRQDGEALAALFASGATLDWTRLHVRGSRRRVSLPTYPFARERHAFPGLPLGPARLPDAQAPSRPSAPEVSVVAARPHPLLESNASTLREHKYVTVFTGAEQVLTDHVVGGHRLLPAAAMLEMACVAASLASEEPVLGVTDLRWRRALRVGDAPVTVETHLEGRDGALVCTLRAPAEEGGQVFAEGTVITAEHDAPQPPEPLSLDETRARMTHTVTADAWYAGFAAGGFSYGPAFRAVKEVHVGEREALARLELPPTEDASAFFLPPGLVDGAFQVVAALTARRPDAAYLPYAVGEAHLHGPLPSICWVHVVARSPEDDGAVLKFDVELVTEQGEARVSFLDFTLVRLRAPAAPTLAPVAPRVPPAASRVAPAALTVVPAEPPPAVPASVVEYLQPEWVEEAAVHGEGPDDALDMLLLFDVDDAVRERIQHLTDGAVRTALVLPGDAFRQEDGLRFHVRPHAAEDYERLLDALCQEGFVPDRVLHLWSRRTDTVPGAQASDVLDHGTRSVFTLSQLLLREDLPRQVRLVYAYMSGTEQAAVHATASGLGKSLWWEDPDFVYKTVQFGNAVELESYDFLESLILELTVREPEGRDVRFVNGRRLVMRWGRFEPGAMGAGHRVLRERGTYLVLGGLGRLGWLCAEHLARTVQARLVLTGRQAATPEREARMESLRQLGAEVLYVPVDLGVASEVTALVEAIHARFGTLHGVFHSAGENRDGLLGTKSLAELDAVLGPKVDGSLLLDAALKDEPLDFWMAFSSLSAMRGNAGQTDYAAASSFLDAFCVGREALRARGERSGRTVSIAWPLWRDGGMHVDAASLEWMRERFGLVPLSTAAGLKALEDGLMPGGPAHFAVLERVRDARDPASARVG
ncbi:SDR family NAD(P)-dependent oxidoreductase [Corallococcus sp. ZKHCc1 1396]|uniref:SDR family NAD(P)-dependent oxidoreductase n=3 Tax=Corallococcus soli TaxID=2710757 RepID=A0ABR9PV97_9BACT|nr:SDR family NAD(P)-dependent oxidoreductase [Corallococcus soli]MBE4751861.1 SDR family NAD(P)-dependent oxidoreductase [Corallococcus soli]